MATANATVSTSVPWDRDVSRYQWWVLLAAFLGWMFDSMDTNLYILTLRPMMVELLGPASQPADIPYYGGIIVAIFLVGWGLGGMLFGVVGDYLGRSRTMVLTILVYAIFTGLVAVSQTWWHVAIFRFITALGIGGEWAAGSALIAETWPAHGRAKAGGIMMSAFSVGYFAAALINLTVGPIGWRWVYLVGIAPAILALLIRLRIKEPEPWLNVHRQRAEIRRRGVQSEADRELMALTLPQLFQGKLLRRTVIASLMCFAATFGFWGTQTWVPAMASQILAAQGTPPPQVVAQVSYIAMALNLGALVGLLGVAWLADIVGRRSAFLIAALGNLIVIPLVFTLSRDYTSMLLLVPLFGVFNNGIFAVFVPYFSELYPTKLRTTGAGFCFNAARIVSAAGPYVAGLLVVAFSGSFALAATVIAAIYLLGLIVGWIAPETRGQPLPE
ncbi:MAG: MFS transporter [Chloroflexi bacterium]|nr:MFS transporter [Chloroflexota bacterium]